MSARAGIYDFTDEAAREFYLLLPTVVIGYDFITISDLKFNVSAGFGYSSFKYNSDRHHVYMMPVFLSAIYCIPLEGSKVSLYAGGGFSLAGKADKNLTFAKSHYSFTYGYHVLGEMDFKLNEKLSLSLDIRYNLLMPPSLEELNISGVVTTVGVVIPLYKGQ